MSEPQSEQLNLEADLSVEDFISRGNLRETGKEVPELVPPADDKKITDDTDEKEVAATDKKDAKAIEGKADDKPIDKRTREGRKLSIQQEIDQLAAQKHDSQREFDAAKLRSAELRAEIAELEAKRAIAGKPTDENKETPAAEWKRYSTMPDAPKPDQFPESYEDYLDARADFIATKRFETLMQQHNANSHERGRAEQWNARFTKAQTADPTLKDRIDPKTPATQQMRDYVIDSDKGVELLVYLSEHKSEAQRLSTLHPLKCAEELGKLEMRLDAAHSGPAQVPAVSQAKPPIKPVDGSPNVSDEVDEGDLPPDEFIRRANKRDGIAMPSAARR